MSESEPTRPLDLSIVIPAFNEEQRLPSAIELVASYLDSRGLAAEVLVVENGSTDRTPAIADQAAERDGRFRALHVARPGKGRAVRTGILASDGAIAVFCDADFSMPVEQLDLLLDAVRDAADVAIASREAKGAQRVGEPAQRHFMGRVFNLVVRALAVSGVDDTQCGFKAFRRAAARDLFGRQRVDGWAFDVEVLYLAHHRGYVVREVPITWRYDPSTRVRPGRDTIAMLRELLMIRWNEMRGRYA